MSMSDSKIYRLSVTALLTALTCVATMIIKVPTPVTNGYVNLGDILVLLSGWLLGPAYGFFAAGVGSALTDLLGGYMAYVPGTLVIKGLMAVTAYGLVFRKADSCRIRTVTRVLSALGAEAVMVLGYFAYEAAFLGYGMAAAASIPGNIVQGIFGLAGGLALYVLLDKTGLPPTLSRTKA